MLGGGFIGPETAENLIHRGFSVTLVEMGKHILAPMDPDMARIAEGYLERHGLRLALNGGVAGLEHGDQGTLKVLTLSGKVHPEASWATRSLLRNGLRARNVSGGMRSRFHFRLLVN